MSGLARRAHRLIIVAAALLLASPVGAVQIGDLSQVLGISVNGGDVNFIDPAVLNCTVDSDSGTFGCANNPEQMMTGNGFELTSWNISGEFDPMLNIGFGFKNTGATATFTIVSSIPVLPIVPSTVMGGSTGGSVTDDGDGFGGLGTSAPDPFFVGLIDGVPQLATSLHPDPSNFPGAAFPGTFAFGGQTVNIPAVFSGLPGPTIPGPAAGASIGIRHRFQLATQDSMGASSFFQVEVPEPGTASLLVLGLVGLAWRIRKH